MILYSLVSLGLCFLVSLSLMLHPLSVGVCVLVASMFACLVISILSYSWYGYMLFLIFWGGLLVMFAYVCASTPNALFEGNMVVVFVLSMSVLMATVFWKVLFAVDGMEVVEMSVPGCLSSSMGESLVYPFSMSVIVGLGIILLVNLLAVVKVCVFESGPLREYY
uniref:NADH-ubiquinone oxidoreductase chain 6 n=1 Tax=Coccocrater sp. MNHN-IM-2013-41044 TaxID=2496600 RepID=A0A6B7FQN3_9GAST|nr:NADH dehydrogenase subunit 6 [Coccocrater sp. MNHN-IM-2013-41044]